MSGRDTRFAEVAGIPVVRADLETATGMLVEDARSERARVYVLVNAHSAKLRRESEAYAAVLLDTASAVCLPDGASVTAAARMLGHGDIGRCPGPDLLEAACEECARQRIPVYLLGGGEGVAAGLAAALVARHPGLEVAGAATPPFGEWHEADSLAMIEAVRASGARVLWVGVSAPKQEVWAYRARSALGMPAVCVGAAFDFNTGAKPRAPRWMRRLGVEWLHRLLTEPRRTWKRYLVGNTLFMADVVRFGRRRFDSGR